MGKVPLIKRSEHREERCSQCSQPRWWHWSMAVQDKLDHEFKE